jgi:hypothetical protein
MLGSHRISKQKISSRKIAKKVKEEKMAGRFDRKEVSGQLQERTKDSFDNRKDSGRFGSYFQTGGEIEFKRWVCGEGDHTFDIIPFIVSEDHPAPSKLKKGKFAYKVDIYTHANIGPNDDIFVCPLMFHKSECCICKERKRLLDAGQKWEDVKHLSPQKRTIYNIMCYDNDEEINKGIQIWDPAFWNMEEHLLRISKNPRTGGIIAYADPWEGRYITFNRTGTKKDNTRYTGHALYERDYQIDEDLLAAAIDPIQIIHIPTNEELYEAFYGQAPVSTGAQTLRPGPGRPAPAAAAESDVRDYEDPPPAEQPPPPLRRGPGSRPAGPPTPPADASVATCPGGGVFGQDVDKLEACPKCTLWNECARENEAQLSAGGPAPAPRRPGPAPAGGGPSKLRRPPAGAR